jgi:hypothetical protein
MVNLSALEQGFFRPTPTSSASLSAPTKPRNQNTFATHPVLQMQGTNRFGLRYIVC